MMIVTLHQASRGGRVKVCQAQGEDGPLRSGGGGTVREELGSGGTAATRGSGGETEIGAEIEKGTGMQNVKKKYPHNYHKSSIFELKCVLKHRYNFFYAKGGKGEVKMLVIVEGEGERSGGRAEEEASGNTTCLSSWRRKNRKMKFKPRQGKDMLCQDFRGGSWEILV